MNKQGVVTNEMLLAFKEQCKPFILRMPYIYQGDQCLSNVKLETTLQYSNFSTLYLSITGVTTENTVVNTELLFRIKSNIWFGYGKNTGHSILTKAIILLEENNNVSLYLIFDKNISELIINTYAKNLDDAPIFKVIGNSREVSSSNLPDNCKYISIDADTSNNRIGTIECLSGTDALFSLITDKIKNTIDGELELETEPYQSGKLFDKIFSSKLTDLLGHNISILYDYDNTLLKGESGSIGNLSNSIIKIPLPKLENSNTDAFTSNDTVYGVIVEKGLVTSGTSDLPKATPDNLGAIKVTTDKDNGKEHYLHIKDDGIGYIKVESNYNQIIQVDLTKESADYNTNKQNYANVIYLHIGSTTEKYKNGYFYKCLKIYNGYITPSTYARYYLLDNEFENDLAWIKFFINQYVSKTKSTTSNLTSLAVTVNEIEDNTQGVASELFFNIIENGGDTGIKGITYSLLCEDYKITIIDVNQIVNKDNFKNYQFTINLTDSGNYSWIQWDAQPRLIDTDATFLRFQGTLEQMSSLLGVINPKPGDVYHIKETSSEYFYKQSDDNAFGSWEELGPVIDFPDYDGETRGLVPVPDYSNRDQYHYLRADGNWSNLHVATNDKLGAIKLGYVLTGKNYPVELSNDKAYVNVPWTDTTYTAGNNIDITNGVISTTNTVYSGSDSIHINNNNEISVIFPSFQSEEIDEDHKQSDDVWLVRTSILNVINIPPDINLIYITPDAETQEYNKTTPYHILINIYDKTSNLEITFEDFGTLKWQNGEYPIWAENTTYEFYIILNCIKWTEFR